MTREEIDTFMAIAKYGSLSEAGRHIHVSQPALGKRLTQLEAEIGVPLVLRGKGVRGIKLTPEGETFHSYAKRFIELSDEMLMVGERSLGANRQTLDIASSDGPHIYVLNDANILFKHKHPDVALRLHTYTYRECYRRVANGRIDAAIVGASYYFDNVVAKPLYSEKMVFICRSDSLYPKVISMENLSTVDCIYSPYSQDFINWFDSWFRLAPLPFIECDLVQQVSDIMRAMGKNAWSIVPETIAQAFVQEKMLGALGFEFRKIKNPPPDRTMYLITAVDHQNDILDSYAGQLSHILNKNKLVRKLI